MKCSWQGLESLSQLCRGDWAQHYSEISHYIFLEYRNYFQEDNIAVVLIKVLTWRITSQNILPTSFGKVVFWAIRRTVSVLVDFACWQACVNNHNLCHFPGPYQVSEREYYIIKHLFWSFTLYLPKISLVDSQLFSSIALRLQPDEFKGKIWHCGL
jgi:hypothetical protein